ncbi:hypothetical protein ACJDU8_25170, partial [Clostridium sp. WILCCON 0269]
EFMPLKNLKIFSNAFPVNIKIAFLKSLPKGIMGACGLILDFFEGRVNTDINEKNYMIVYISQAEIAKEFRFSREYISHCINRMAESPICPFVKVRQGLNKAKYYIMQKKKELVYLLKQIYQAQQKEAKAKNIEKQDKQKRKYGKNNKGKISTFNNFKPREYDFEKLERQLLGWEDLE